MPTNNPVPSTDPSDLLFNAGVLDAAVNSSASTYQDRFGKTRMTVSGATSAILADVATVESSKNTAVLDMAADVATVENAKSSAIASISADVATVENAKSSAIASISADVAYVGGVADLLGMYVGASANDPTTRVGGTSLQNGDFYLNTGINRMKAYANGSWYATETLGDTDAALVGYTADGANAVATTVQNKLSDFVSVKDFGAVGDGGASSTVDADAANNASAAVSNSGGGRVLFPGGEWDFPFTKPPTTVFWEFEGPSVNRAQLGGSGTNVFYKTARLSYLPGPHNSTQQNAEALRVIATGSGAIGAPKSDQALQITIEKENWTESSGEPVAGELNGLAITTRNGCVTGDPVKTGGAAILADIAQTAGSGYTQAMECLNTVYTKETLVAERQINTQLNGIDEKTNSYVGLSLKSLVGEQTAALLIQNNVGSNWGEAIRISTSGIRVFRVYDTGEVVWRKTQNMTLAQESETNDLVFKNEAGTELGRFAQTHFIPKPAPSRTISGDSYTIVSSTADAYSCDFDRLISMANGATVASVTCPNNAPTGFRVRFLQRDPAQVTFFAASGAIVHNRQGHTKTAGKYSVVTLEVASNSGGSSAVWYLYGDTGT